MYRRRVWRRKPSVVYANDKDVVSSGSRQGPAEWRVSAECHGGGQEAESGCNLESPSPRRVARSNSVNVLALCIGYSLGMLATWSVRSPVSARRASARKGIAVILAIVVVACGLLGRQTVVGWDANRLHLYLAPCLSIDVVTGALSEPELSRRYFWL